MSLEFGVWSLEFGVWSLEFGVWSLEFGVWSLEFGVWSLEFGVWSLDGSIPKVQKLCVCPHPLTPNPKHGIRGTRIMSPLSHIWERGWG